MAELPKPMIYHILVVVGISIIRPNFASYGRNSDLGVAQNSPCVSSITLEVTCFAFISGHTVPIPQLLRLTSRIHYIIRLLLCFHRCPFKLTNALNSMIICDKLTLKHYGEFPSDFQRSQMGSGGTKSKIFFTSHMFSNLSPKTSNYALLHTMQCCTASG